MRVSPDTGTTRLRYACVGRGYHRSVADFALGAQTVKQNQVEYGLPLKILSYNELYGWTMDKIVEQVGRRNNCASPERFALRLELIRVVGTFCGVFRRQALDRGAAQLGVDHIVTGHNADDIAETVLMNSLFQTSMKACELINHGSHARRYR